MRVFGWVLGALAGWTVIGLLGTVLAWITADRRRAWRSLAWIAGVWVIYGVVLLGVSEVQAQRTLAPGQEECFESMCFSIRDVTEVGGFGGYANGRLVQVGVRVRNAAGEPRGVEGLRGYLVDTRGGTWEQTPGVGGVLLTVRLPPGGVTVSKPVFRIPDGAEMFGLVLTREHTGWNWLVIGDTDAVWHRRTVLLLK